MPRHTGSSRRKHEARRRREQQSRRQREQEAWRKRAAKETRDGLNERDPAEKWLNDSRHYLDRDDAPWRSLPATPGQVAKLRALNANPIAFPTRGAASAEISRILEARRTTRPEAA
jgi:hypothetical protein